MSVHTLTVICSLSFQCAYFRLHIGNTCAGSFYFAVKGLLEPPSQVAIVVCLFVFGLRLRSLLFCLVVFVCGSRYALLAWGSAFRLFAVGYLFLICRLALYRLGHFL